jgi:hypothetical protein
MYTEPQIFEIINRLSRIYLESYPGDKEGLERFVRWAHLAYGYNPPLRNEEKTNSMRV